MLLQNSSITNPNANVAKGNAASGNQTDPGNTSANGNTQPTNSNSQPINFNTQESPNSNLNNPNQPLTDWGYIFLLMAIILIFGSLGGWVSHLLNEPESPNNSGADNPPNPNGNKVSWVKPIVIGIAAAFLVPLFLQTISSQLLRDGYKDYLSLMFFAGFCLIAAISSKAFITTLSDKILQVAKEAKKEAREAKNEAEKAKDSSETAIKTAVEAKENSVDAQGTAASARSVALGAGPLQPAVPLIEAAKESVSLEADPETEKESLIKEYNDIRETMDSGWARTAEMSRILRRMISLMPKFTDLPVIEYLNEKENLGRRLFGYAYFFYRPEREFLPALIESVARVETKPFAQYWGILAIGKVLAEKSQMSIDAEIIQQLQNFLTKLPVGTDRWKELKNVLARQDR